MTQEQLVQLTLPGKLGPLNVPYYSAGVVEYDVTKTGIYCTIVVREYEETDDTLEDMAEYYKSKMFPKETGCWTLINAHNEPLSEMDEKSGVIRKIVIELRN